MLLQKRIFAQLVLKTMKITVINAEASIKDGKILANNEYYECNKIITATGAKPREIKGRITMERDSRQLRCISQKFETREDGENLTIEGYFAVFNSIYQMDERMSESIEREVKMMLDTKIEQK